MNENHARVCPSPEWAAYLQDEVLPSLTEHANLGEDMLEIGPGPGAATAWLRHRVRRLTALEVDHEAAGKLADRYAGGNVEVVAGNAADLSFPDASFDSVGCFTMLLHADDTYNPIEPASLVGRLQTLGFDKITVTMDAAVKFVARKAAEPSPGDTA